MNNPNKQKGVALIGVLIIVALITASYSLLLNKQSELFETTKLSIEQNQVFNYFYFAQSFAKSKLLENSNDKKNKYDGLDEDWATEVYLKIPGGYMSGQVVDRSIKLNINDILVIKDNQIKISTSENSACLLRMMHKLNIESIDGFIVDYLSQQESPSKFKHLSDLRKVPGITPEIYQKLEPFLYANQVDFNLKININTAPKEIITCLHDDIDNFVFESIRDNRPIKTISKLSEILQANLTNVSAAKIKKQIMPLININSTYFELKVEIKVGDSLFKATSLLIDKGGKIDSYYRSFEHQL